MDDRSRLLFLLLILAQALHSAEEYAFRLYDRFAPTRFLTDLTGLDRPLAFALLNLALVLFGLWCWAARIRPGHRAARGFAWFWALLETANGLGHASFALDAGGYFPGVATAPLLLGLGVWLMVRLVRTAPGAA